MKKLVILVLAIGLIVTGCQKTPDKSSVISKKDGLDEELIIEPYTDDEKRSTDIPEYWEMNEKKSNDRVTVAASLELGEMEIGNLPVVEMKNHVLDEKELKKLVLYFLGNEEIYAPQIFTKEDYQNIVTRMENKKGAYADVSMWTVYQEMKTALEEAANVAPEKISEAEKAEIKFGKKTSNPALEKAVSWSGVNISENGEKSVWFEADIGDKRDAHIKAETYDSSLENSSSFSWKEGANTVGYDEIQSTIMRNNSANKSEYTESFTDVLERFQTYIEKNVIKKEDGEVQTERVLDDLGIKDMKVSSYEKVLWFPSGAMPDKIELGASDDFLWQAELDKAEAGYEYTFSRAIEDLCAMGENGNSFLEQTDEMYTSPFPVETITVTVTASGIKNFVWKGISEEVATIAENTELISFDIIQEQLTEQIFYFYTIMGQPANDTTTFDYNIVDAKLGYTYITAFEEPQNAWLVPAWFFDVTGSKNNIAYQKVPYIIDALDGRVITW